MLNIKLHSKPVYDEKYIKAKVKTFNGVINTILRWWDFKRKSKLHFHINNNYWFCHENK